jgi:tetratricopeptide (TPR) repeat protein
MAEWRAARLEDIDEQTDGRVPWRPLRHHLGIRSFGLNSWTGHAVGDRIINEHDEKDEHEELYLVHSGRARFEIGGETVDAPVGTLVYAKPGVLRTAFAEEPNTTLIAMGGEPGKPYRAGGFEVWAPIEPLYKAGRYEEAAALGKEAADRYPQYSMVVYNIACCEAMAGRTDDAIEHLGVAIAGNEDVKKWAAGDSDLESLREDPRFQKLFA